MERSVPQFDAVVPAAPEVQPVFAPSVLRTSSELAALPESDLAVIIGRDDVTGLDRPELLRLAREAQLAKLFPLQPPVDNTPAKQPVIEVAKTAAAPAPEQKPRPMKIYSQEERDTFLRGLLDQLLDNPVPVPVIGVQDEKSGEPLPWLADLVAETPQTDSIEAHLITDEIPVQEAIKPHSRVRGLLRRMGRFAAVTAGVVSVGLGVGHLIDKLDDTPQKKVAAPAATVAINETTDSVAATSTTTSTTPETTTTTEPKPYSYFDSVRNGDITMEHTAGARIATINIPDMCLFDIEAYGSFRMDISNTEQVQPYLLENNIATPEEISAWNSGGRSNRLEADIKNGFDPIYKLIEDETPQEACDTMGPSAKTPRWLADISGSGSTESMQYRNSGSRVANLTPIVDIIRTQVLPGEVGNVVISGHRNTESAPFKNLDALKVGSEIFIMGDDGRTYIYVVEGSDVVGTSRADWKEVTNHKSASGNDRTIALLTCDGDERLVVYGVFLGEA